MLNYPMDNLFICSTALQYLKVPNPGGNGD
jgi:hypothetical protein